MSAFIEHNRFEKFYQANTNFEKNQEYLLQRDQELQTTVGSCNGQINISILIHTQQSEAWAEHPREDEEFKEGHSKYQDPWTSPK